MKIASKLTVEEKYWYKIILEKRIWHAHSTIDICDSLVKKGLIKRLKDEDKGCDQTYGV